MRHVAFVSGIFVVFGASAVQSQSVTAFKTGEKTTGMTKQCYYSFGSNEYTKTVSNVALCPLSIVVPTSSTAPKRDTLPTPQSAAITAFKTGEKTTGMTKQCFYSFGSSEYTKTIGSVELCPLSIRVKQ